VLAFGTDDEMEAVESLLIIKHAPFPARAPDAGEPGGGIALQCPGRQGPGRPPSTPGAFRPSSLVNLSGMSCRSLSPAAVEALTRAAQMTGCLHSIVLLAAQLLRVGHPRMIQLARAISGRHAGHATH
jgi:hypothetical protein